MRQSRSWLYASAVLLDRLRPLSGLAWTCFVVSIGAPLFAQGDEVAGKSRPNVLLFLVDDMGWQDTSVPFGSETTPANRHFRTPNMERLAKQGVRFTNAYSHAVCSPTRTSIMTGQNPARHHVTQWTLRKDKDPSGAWGRVGSPAAWRRNGLQPGDTTLPALLRSTGYFTIHCGKAHWGAHGTKGSDPLNLGFDVNIAGHAAGAPGSYQGEANFGNKEAGGYNKPWGVPGLESYHGKPIHLTDACTTEAKLAVTRAVDARQPFFLYVAHYAVHTPIQPHPRFMKGYSGERYDDTEIDIPPVEARYASMVEGMDASLGALLEHLESLEVASNTLVIFTSDNGGLSAHARGKTPRGTGDDTHNHPLRAGKGSAYEGGTRVPYIVSWAKPLPDHPSQQRLPLTANTVSEQPLICEDLFPTVLGACSVTIPEDYEVDGLDVRDRWRRQSEASERTLIFHYPHVWGPRGDGYEPHSAMRLGQWKLAYFYNDRRWELYDLAGDPGEKRDLATAKPAHLAKLTQAMRTEMQRRGAQWPVDRETGAADEPRWLK